MITVIRQETVLEAWVAATRHLLGLREGRTFNMLIDIEDPDFDPGVDEAIAAVNRFMVEKRGEAWHSLVEPTIERIFAYQSWKKWGLDGLYNKYPNEIYPDLPKAKWGTYSHRMVRYGNMNPLKVLVDKMKSELSINRAPMRSCYELPLYWPARDGKLRLGLPCLTHLSFKIDGPQTHMNVMYRSHDYTRMAFSNYIAMMRMIQVIAKETGQAVGNMLIHSSYAFLNGSKTDLARVVDIVEQIIRRS